MTTQVSDSFLASLAAEYSKPEGTNHASVVQATVQAVRQKPVMRKLRQESAPSPNAAKPRVMLTIPVPAKGSLDAKGFMLAMRVAGTRHTEEGKPYVNSLEIRNDQIKAIAAYIGYDAEDHFGSQDLRARMQAARELNPRTFPASAMPELRRWTPNMPDPIAKRGKDLLGRERMAADAICEHRKAATEATDDETRTFQMSLALLEEERLREIRNQITELLASIGC